MNIIHDFYNNNSLDCSSGCWDAERETLKPLRAEAAPEMAAAQGALSMATMLYGLTL